MPYIVSKRCRTYSVIREGKELHLVFFDDGKLTSIQVFEGEGIELVNGKPKILKPTEAQSALHRARNR